MAKFIELTALRRNNEKVVLNVDAIEYMLSIPGSAGTALYSITHHTKYEVAETLDEILTKLDDLGMVIGYAPKTSPIMEVKDNEDHCI